MGELECLASKAARKLMYGQESAAATGSVKCHAGPLRHRQGSQPCASLPASATALHKSSSRLHLQPALLCGSQLFRPAKPHRARLPRRHGGEGVPHAAWRRWHSACVWAMRLRPCATLTPQQHGLDVEPLVAGFVNSPAHVARQSCLVRLGYLPHTRCVARGRRRYTIMSGTR